MSNRKPVSCLSGSNCLPDKQMVPPGVHPRFAARIERVFLEKDEAARQSLVNTYCLLKKAENQLHAHEKAFGDAQYNLIAGKCVALCRNARLAATSDRPQQSQVLALRDQVLELRNTVAATRSDEFRVAPTASARSLGPTSDNGQAAVALLPAQERSPENEDSFNARLTGNSDFAAKFTTPAAGSQGHQQGHFSL